MASCLAGGLPPDLRLPEGCQLGAAFEQRRSNIGVNQTFAPRARRATLTGRLMTILLWVLGVALVLVGLAGILLPALPGTILIFLGLLLAAWADGFARVGVPTLVLIGVLGAVSYGIDFVAAALGARHIGASGRAMLGAAVGTLLALPFGLPGLLLGPLVGAVVGEFTVHQNVGRAGRVGIAAWIGFAIGSAVKIALAFAMVGIFLAALLVF
jgi:uncharacterized protein YqgC (DUF456 family)